MNQDLGIFTANGNIVLSSTYSNDNLQVDGSQAVIGSNCASSSCGFLVNGCINTFNNVGGQIQTNIFGACMNVQNTYYDRRYTSRAGFSPPWFPATTITNIAGHHESTHYHSSTHELGSELRPVSWYLKGKSSGGSNRLKTRNGFSSVLS